MPITAKRDESGKVVPHDDPCIDDAGWLIRHINPDYHVVDDENSSPPRRRLASSVFSCTNGDPDHGLSVDIGQMLIEAGKALAAMVPAGFGAIQFEVGDVRSRGLQVGSDPIKDENEYHGQVWGVKDNIRKKLHKNLQIDWLIPLYGVDIR